jgi:hypothetical protein
MAGTALTRSEGPNHFRFAPQSRLFERALDFIGMGQLKTKPAANRAGNPIRTKSCEPAACRERVRRQSVLMSQPETGKTTALAILIAAGWHPACKHQLSPLDLVATAILD